MIYVFWGALIAVAAAMVGFVYRVIKGPTIPDRVVALDALGVALISIIALLSVVMKTQFFLEIILLLGILSFIGTVAFSKFIERGEIFERDDNNH
ncbi:Na(+)/H(+) antiporter subunit F1 [Pueribacillus theae]|uniref:Na(+)/H(+) antiporter subunit F1 n=1 Tax=Pueribacillus theae TaxID=2171751 RepID=A0A2U1K678_9BACI|nr:Na(+)/H(+) antiporter subunit F1 [Pueribacillus theae]PWA12755.1 Na(+)/H(+) antiporter subunit F1 [Pueribacillus theae]